MLMRSSSEIFKLSQTDKDCLQYHIDFVDDKNMLNKLEQIYLSEANKITDEDYLTFNRITRALKIQIEETINDGNHFGLSTSFGSSDMFKLFYKNSIVSLEPTTVIKLNKSNLQNFSIHTKKNECICRIYDAYSSKVIQDFLQKIQKQISMILTMTMKSNLFKCRE